MNRAQAQAAIQESISRGSATPCPAGKELATYIAEQSQALLQALITPVPAQISGETFSYGTKDQLSKEELYAIARRQEHWLIYSATSGHFSLAFGSEPQALSILGFSSTDALAEWLG